MITDYLCLDMKLSKVIIVTVGCVLFRIHKAQKQVQFIIATEKVLIILTWTQTVVSVTSHKNTIQYNKKYCNNYV